MQMKLGIVSGLQGPVLLNYARGRFFQFKNYEKSIGK